MRTLTESIMREIPISHLKHVQPLSLFLLSLAQCKDFPWKKKKDEKSTGKVHRSVDAERNIEQTKPRISKRL